MPGMHCTPKLIPRSCLFILRALLCSPGRPEFRDLLSRKPSFWDSGFHCHIEHPALSIELAPLAQEHGLILMVITLWCAVLERLVRALL